MENKMYTVGLTGGIATGKSTVGNFIKKRNFPYIDADLLCHKMSKKNGILWKLYVDHFGDIILDEKEELNRKALRDIIFESEEEKKWLNETIHPFIKNSILEKMASFKGKSDILFVDIPLLFEKKWESYFDEIWLCDIDLKTQIKRVEKRDKVNKKQALSIINSQMPQEEKRKLANKIIKTNESFKILEEKVNILLEELLERIRIAK